MVPTFLRSFKLPELLFQLLVHSLTSVMVALPAEGDGFQRSVDESIITDVSDRPEVKR